MRLPDGLAKEPLGRGRISPRSQKEIDRLPSAVHRPIEIRPASLHPNVGFVHPPGAVAHSQMRAGSLFKLRCVGLDPSEDRRVVDLDSAVEEHEFQIAVADREHQIPSHGPKDRLSCELRPLETITQTHTDTRPSVPPQSYGKSASSKVRTGAPFFVRYEPRGLRYCADSRLSRLVHLGEEDEVLLDHAPRELRDIGLVEIIGGLKIDFLDVQEFPVSFDFVADVIAIELGPGLQSPELLHRRLARVVKALHEIRIARRRSRA